MKAIAACARLTGRAYGTCHAVTISKRTGARVGISTLSRTLLVSDSGNTVPSLPS